MSLDKKTLIKYFEEKFSGEPRIFRAPGRVNLIGEHTDYNDGFVFPMAINNYTTIGVTPRPDRKLDIFSRNLEEKADVNLDKNEPAGEWFDYLAGVAAMLEEKGTRLPGANLYIYSDVPVGAGLSSSAALEISSALALLSTTQETLNPKELALLGQRAENQFVGMNCGIMDQFISVHGQKDHALFLDCRSLDYRLVPLPSDQVRIVICNTMVKHELGASEYNNRRNECEKGVSILKNDYPDIQALRDGSLDQFITYQDKLPPIVRKRCFHVISENARTEQSIHALESGDLFLFGELMNGSHDSLRDDYAVSCKELDIMVEIARNIDGVLGARMTGGGFGGCTVNLVKAHKVDAFCDQISQQYQKKARLEPDIYVSAPAQGACEWK